MKYVLHENYRLRGYEKLPTGLFSTLTRKVTFFPQDLYRVLLRCNGAYDIDLGALSERELDFLHDLEERGTVRPARFAETLLPEQVYRRYPAEYRRDCHWSITGCCNFQCRHCFMSAPQAKHGTPSWEQLIDVADQLAECGVFNVGITGGEPLIRGDLLPLLDELEKRDIAVTAIYTNGWLMNKALLDALEERRMRPAFQLSFDGVGQHDFLRGVDGAEDRTLEALGILQERGYRVSVSMCLHRGNVGTIAETVRLMGSLGVLSMKIAPMMELGAWANPEMRQLYLTEDEALQAYCDYIPQYFEDDAPVDIMLGGCFMFRREGKPWGIYNVRPCFAEEEGKMPSCGVLLKNFYVSAEGRVAPCMGMDDCTYAANFPNLHERPLREILTDPAFTRLERATVKDVRDANPECRSCEYVDRCTGGCRNNVLIHTDDYYGIDKELCRFFEGGWEKKVAAIAEPAYQAYCRRHPEFEEDVESGQGRVGETFDFC